MAHEIGERVMVKLGSRGYVGTVMEFACEDRPVGLVRTYALIRFDAWHKRDNWVDLNYLHIIEGVVPGARRTQWIA